MTKHTPGPWRRVGDFIHDSSNIPFAVAYTPVTQDNPVAVRDANARLIAAAPELLEFAEQIFNGLETGMISMSSPADETLANVLTRGRNALYEAKGHEPCYSPPTLGGAK